MKNKIIRDFVASVWDTLGTAEQNKMIPVDMSQLTQYEVVVALPTIRNMDKLEFIGYPTQVRKSIGAFGSDIVFLRDSKGDLSTWENQGFLVLNEDQLSFIEPYFEEFKKEDMEYDGECTIGGKYPEKGWIIEKPDAVPVNIAPMSVTLEDGEGNIVSQTIVSQ